MRRLAAAAACLMWLFATHTNASRLPIRPYTTKDGLPHDAAWRIKRDSTGFLWFCTPEGLSRFDGKVFVNYGTAHGLPEVNVEDVVEAPDGSFRVALAWHGIARFDPAVDDHTRLFTPLPLGDDVGRTTALAYDGAGRLWIGTNAGLYATDGAADRFVAVDLAADGVPARPRIWRLLVDGHGNLWVATSVGLVVRTPDGRVRRRAVLPGDAQVEVYELIQDDRGRIWAGHDRGVSVLVAGDLDETVTFVHTPGAPDGALELPAAPGESGWYGVEDGVGDGLVAALHQTTDGTVWLAPMKGGLTEFDGERFVHLRPEDGPGAFLGRGLVEDVEGNLWIGTLDRGAMRLARTGLTAFDENDGLAFSSNAAIAQDAEGGIVVAASSALYGFDGSRFVAVHPGVLASHRTGRTGQNAAALHDTKRRWWLGTPNGLYRFATGVPLAALGQATPTTIFSTRNGLPTDQVTGLFEARDGSIWIALALPARLARLRGDRIEIFTEADGLPPSALSALAEDAGGALWVGSGRGLARLRDGRFERLGEDRDAMIRDLFSDGHGRMWVATHGGGLSRVDEPTSAAPVFSRLTTADGLASNVVRAITDDESGRIYLGTTSGIDRYDPDSGDLRHYGSVHGLSNEEIQMAWRDRAGSLWFTSRRGVTRLRPGEDRLRPRSEQGVRLTGLRIGDVEHPLSELGENQIEGLRIAPDLNRLQIAFRGIDFALDDDRRYEYKLEGSDQAWSTPVASGEVNYARLAAGRYRFVVRPVGEEATAAVGFEILPPFWRRAWFLVLVGVALAAAIHSVYRYRLARVLELERVRTRIATDLHDDIGASLSQIAILSEVLQQQKGRADPDLDGPLSRIAASSREMIDSMSDIVWAINPKRDRLRDVVQRMRRFASDTLSARDIELSFSAPHSETDLRLGADIRRQVYLVFKESLNNAVRHSGCRRVEIELRKSAGSLTLSIRDDGNGFDTATDSDGNGLASIRRRAEELAGILRIDSAPGHGTTVWLQVPLGRRSLPV